MKKTFLLSVLLNIFLCSCAGKVDTVYVMSPSMNKLIPNIIITPDNYQKNNEALPVLYLLHGATGDFKSWLSNAPVLEDYACLLYTSPSPRDRTRSRMPSSA